MEEFRRSSFEYRVAIVSQEQANFCLVARFGLAPQTPQRCHGLGEQWGFPQHAGVERVEVGFDQGEHPLHNLGGRHTPRQLPASNLLDGFLFQECHVAKGRQAQHGSRALNAVDQAVRVLEHLQA